MAEARTELRLGGLLYGGWKEIRIARGMEQASGAFELVVSERWDTAIAARAINEGDACEVLIDSEVVITGYVDAVKPSYDKESHAIAVVGRDRAADIVDCSAIHKGGQWRDRTLTQICADLARPFGVSVSARADVGAPFPSYAIQEGETAWECMERAARMRGVLIVSDGRGGLVIDRVGTERVADELVEGVNILRADAERSWQARHSVYIVKGQAQGSDHAFGAAVASQKAEATDPVITRYRPLIIHAEDQGNASTFGTRAAWERNVRMGRGSRATVTVHGWRHSGGLWQPNRRVRVRSPMLDVDADLVIAAVTLRLDESGTLAELAMNRPEAFDVQPAVQPKGSRKSAIWP